MDGNPPVLSWQTTTLIFWLLVLRENLLARANLVYGACGLGLGVGCGAGTLVWERRDFGEVVRSYLA